MSGQETSLSLLPQVVQQGAVTRDGMGEPEQSVDGGVGTMDAAVTLKIIDDCMTEVENDDNLTTSEDMK